MQNMALRFGPTAILLMLMSDDARFGLGLVLLCRVAGVLSLFAVHPLLAPFFQTRILYLDSLSWLRLCPLSSLPIAVHCSEQILLASHGCFRCLRVCCGCLLSR